ncbi:MAG TPA: hypothetical protein VNO32_05360 [Candidatus Acidoferrum sp.]|nr:hypothetical protein [Candidatus Acidoferrum sp.]
MFWEQPFSAASVLLRSGTGGWVGLTAATPEMSPEAYFGQSLVVEKLKGAKGAGPQQVYF